MHLPLAYTFSYGPTPSAEQVQFRFWLFIALLSLPALLVYFVSKIEGDEFKASFFGWAIIGVPLLLGIVVPIPGAVPIWAVSLAVLVLCSGLELLRYGMGRKVLGVIGAAGGFFIVKGMIQSCFTDFMIPAE